MHLSKDNSIRDIFLVFVAVNLFLVLAFTNISDSYAAIKGYKNINKWEEKVIKKGSETLTYKGRVYYAYGEYVDQLKAYLNKKDIDLSEAEAKDAIKEITNPANAKSGAQEGYLYQVGGKPKKGDTSSNSEYDGKLYPEFNKKKRFRNEDEYKASDLYIRNKKYIDAQTGVDYRSKSAMHQDIKLIAKSQRKYQRILSTRGGKGSITEITIHPAAGPAFLVIEVMMLLLTLLIAVKSLKAGTIAVLKGNRRIHRNNQDKHEMRQKLRKKASAVLLIIFTVELIVVYTGMAYSESIGSDIYIDRSMDNGGVYQNGFMVFRDDVHDYLKRNKLSQSSLDMALSYRTYHYDSKNANRTAMRNGTKKYTVSNIQDSIDSQVKLLAYVAKEDSGKISKKVNKLYRNSVNIDVGLFIHKFRQSIGLYFIFGMIVAFIALSISALLLLFERRDIYRGLADLNKGVASGTLIWGIMTAVLAVAADKLAIDIMNDDMYVTMDTAFRGLLSVMLIIFAGSAIISILLFAVPKFLNGKKA